MRNIYIALIFIGVISLGFGQQKPFPSRVTPGKCTSVVPPFPAGCLQCEENQDQPTTFYCSKAQDGYYLLTNQKNESAQECPRSCAICDEVNGCTKCATDGFKSSNNQFDQCSECKEGYTMDNPSLSGYDAVCISVAEDGQYSCDVEYVWGSTPNANRKCVPKTGNCQTGYVTYKNSTDSTENCIGGCADGYTQLTGVAVNGNTQRYNIQTCVNYVLPTPRTNDPAQCKTTGKEKTEQCKECDEGTCNKAEDGFYVKDGKVSACPSQCKTCANGNSCQTCVYGTLNAENNCDCGDKKTPNIDQSFLTTPSVSFICISYEEGAQCATGNNWNAPAILIDPKNQKCLSNYNTGSCYQDPEGTNNPGFDQTSYWNAPINPNTVGSRQCVLNNLGDCQTGYSVNGTITTKITGDCDSCASGYPTLTGVGIDPTNNYYPYLTLCQQQTPFPTRPAGEACTAVDANTTGCEKCTGGKCTEFSKGYFNLNDQAAACPLQCSECTNATACTECPDNSEKDANNNCICKNGYAPSIDRASATISNSYACISQIKNYPCSTNYVWNTPSILLDSSNFECISIYDLEATCYVDSTPKTTLIQTGYWNAPINPATASQRSCVLTGSGSCLTNYATASNISANISSSCNLCAAGINAINGIGQDAKNSYYNYTLCMVQEVTQLRAKAVQCNGTDQSTNGCDVCNSAKGTCTTPKPGYFINSTNPNSQPSRLRNLAQALQEGEGYVYACNSQCSTCDDAKSCKSCQPGYKPVDGNCLCQGENIIPSISEDQALLPTSSFVCINKFTSQCTSNYTWNSQYPLTNLQEYKCINLYDNQCYLQTAGGSGTNQTNYWDSAPNPNRKCVLATNGLCASSYAQVEGGSSKSDNLTKNCDFCASGLVMSNDALNKTCGAPSNSSLLSLSFILLSIILALII